MSAKKTALCLWLGSMAILIMGVVYVNVSPAGQARVWKKIIRDQYLGISATPPSQRTKKNFEQALNKTNEHKEISPGIFVSRSNDRFKVELASDNKSYRFYVKHATPETCNFLSLWFSSLKEKGEALEMAIGNQKIPLIDLSSDVGKLSHFPDACRSSLERDMSFKFKWKVDD